MIFVRMRERLVCSPADLREYDVGLNALSAALRKIEEYAAQERKAEPDRDPE